MAHEAGKGDKRRPTDDAKYSSGYDLAFGDRKPTRGSFIWDSEKGEMVDKEAYYANKYENQSHMVINDIQPYKSMVTGEMITSRSQHRAHLKQHGMIEVGNEVNYMMNMKPEQKKDELKEHIAREVYRKLKY